MVLLARHALLRLRGFSGSARLHLVLAIQLREVKQGDVDRGGRH